MARPAALCGAKWPLPRGVNPEKFSAGGAKGVLTVHLAKSPEVGPKRVEVRNP